MSYGRQSKAVDRSVSIAVVNLLICLAFFQSSLSSRVQFDTQYQHGKQIRKGDKFITH